MARQLEGYMGKYTEEKIWRGVSHGSSFHGLSVVMKIATFNGT
jgi:hypothetical protein